MKTTVEDISPVKRRLSVEIEPEEVNKRIDKAYLELKKRVRLRGFRPGKVPIKILEARFGERVKDEVIQDIIRDTFPEAAKELDRLPIGVPSFEFDRNSFKRDAPFHYSVVIEVKPKVEIKNYLGIELEKPEVQVTEEMINKELDKIKEMHGKIVSIKEDRPVKMGDYVLVNYQGFYKGKPMSELKRENAIIKIGSRDTHPVFETSLIGLNKGDETQVSVDFEENYPNPALAGKNIKFRVQILDIKEMELPELTDDFVKEKFKLNSLQELKEDIKKKLLEQEEKKAEMKLKEEVLNRLIKGVDIELPEVLIESEQRYMIESFKQDLRRGGSSLEDFGFTEDKLKEDFRPRAERRVKEMLILAEIADKENIDISDEELNEEIKKIAEMGAQDPEDLKRFYEERNLMGYLRVRMREQKTLNYILENAKIKETEKGS